MVKGSFWRDGLKKYRFSLYYYHNNKIITSPTDLLFKLLSRISLSNSRCSKAPLVLLAGVTKSYTLSSQHMNFDLLMAHDWWYSHHIWNQPTCFWGYSTWQAHRDTFTDFNGKQRKAHCQSIAQVWAVRTVILKDPVQYESLKQKGIIFMVNVYCWSEPRAVQYNSSFIA